MSEMANATITIPQGVDMVQLVGAESKIAHFIEDSFDATVTLRGDKIAIAGEPAAESMRSRSCSPTSSTTSWLAIRPTSMPYAAQSGTSNPRAVT